MASIFPLELGGGGRAGRRLSEVLKALRRLRGLRPAEVAEAMDMPLRSYQHFEAGRGRINLGHIQAFAEATDTDGLAILASLNLDSPAFAVRCADNKAMTVFMMSLGDFDRLAGDRIARLSARAFFAAFGRAFAALEEEACLGGPQGPPEGPPDDGA